MDSLKVTDEASRAVAVAPRVSLADIEAAIETRYDVIGRKAVRHPEQHGGKFVGPAEESPLDRLSMCLLVMKNGFVIIGKSAPASPENFNAELGRQYAYEDAVRQLWPLMGFALRDKLAAGNPEAWRNQP